MGEFNCIIARGGTSKGVFLFEAELPQKGSERDRVIKRIMGTPDPRQIDGLGGADILTSKVAIIGPPTRSDADVDYTFAQVGIDRDTVSYEGNCGNISAAVGPLAIEKGLIHLKERNGTATVRIHNTNISKVIVAEVPIKDGKPEYRGNYQVDGVPGGGACIMLDFSKTQGSLNGKLLPTGNVIDQLEVNGDLIDASIVDLANPVAFIRAKDINLKGVELPQQIDSNPQLIELLELIRGAAAVKLGLVEWAQEAFSKTPFIPFLCVVAEPQDCLILGQSRTIKSDEVDVQSRLVGIKKTHKTFPGTGAVCLASAARIAGTIVHEVTHRFDHNQKDFRIGHPSGLLTVTMEQNCHGEFERIAFGRTWRKIMEGRVFA